MKSLFALLTLFLLSNTTIAQIYTDYSPIAANTNLENQLLAETNKVRRQAGLKELKFDPQLALAARHHAQEMSQLNYFSHQSPTPASKTPAMRLARAGSAVVSMGENLALVHQENVAGSAINGWMNSPGHRKNLLNPNFSHVGFGTATNNHGMEIVVQVLADEPFKLVAAEVRDTVIDAHEVVATVSVTKSAEYIFEIAGELQDVVFLQTGTHEMHFVTNETGLVSIQAGIMNNDKYSYITQDSGWINLTTNQFQLDEIASKQYLKLLRVSSSPIKNRTNEVFLIFDGIKDQELAAFVNDEYIPNIVTPQGYVHLSIPAKLRNPEISIGIATGQNVTIPYLFTLDTSHGQAFLKPKALN